MILSAAIVNEWQYASTADITDTTAVEVKAASAANRHRVTGIHVVNSDIAVGTYVQLLTASTVIWTGWVGPYIAAAPGCNVDGDQFVKSLIGGVNEAINVVVVTTSAQVRVSVQGVTVTG